MLVAKTDNITYNFYHLSLKYTSPFSRILMSILIKVVKIILA